MVKWLKDYLSVGGGNMKVLLVVGTIGVLLVILHVPSVTGAELWTVCYSVDYADATELEPTHRLVRPIPDSSLTRSGARFLPEAVMVKDVTCSGPFPFRSLCNGYPGAAFDRESEALTWMRNNCHRFQ